MAAELIIVERTASTNTAARQLFDTLDDGSCFCALEQYSGRGRLGRKWVTPPGTALCFSAVFKDVTQAFHAGAIIALAALDMLKTSLPGLQVFFKWPNDLYVGKNKLAGILSEGVISGGKLAGVVSGIGINLNQNRDDLSKLDNPATSLFVESGCRFETVPMCQKLFDRIQMLNEVYHRAPEQIIAKWQKANALIGHTLEVIRPDGARLTGIFSGIAPDGAMLLSVNGATVRFDCGDVKIDPASLPHA
ncbi:MAG: biotin--[Lentisphaeria bacterium]|nr:biotin--[acetyl-CoA-carboxylase] ligase [Lentisphaeria bacterium]